MTKKVYSCRDIKADRYFSPLFVDSPGFAIRMFSDAVNDRREGNMLALHPEDFELVELGEWDDETADFRLLGAPRQVATGSSLVKGAN